MSKKKHMGPAKSGRDYADVDMLKVPADMAKAMAKHKQHHSPESKYDGMTLPYSKNRKISH